VKERRRSCRTRSGADAEGPGEVNVPNADKTFTPPEISAMILQKMKQTAEDYLGQR
jgi:molecular chaperone DnaK (HSP70)